jgi:hypothetical protein
LQHIAAAAGWPDPCEHPRPGAASVTDIERDVHIEEAILAYLSEHPDAMETREGIAEWWVMRRVVRAEVEAITQVLRTLTERGILEEIGAGPQCRYRLRKQP